MNRLAEGPKHKPAPPQLAEPPAKWPARFAMVLGGVCFVAWIVAWVQVGGARDARTAAEVAVDKAAVQEAPMEQQRSLVRAFRETQADVGRWKRRRLGLFLAGVVLLLGGFWASGIRALYDKMTWAEVDEPDDFEDFDDEEDSGDEPASSAPAEPGPS